ncbi:MHO_1590 family protein [Mycoplasmopsis felis]|uniref:MHO_1590 family protein n=1 Tax=Mycoplasmopsis felis TaxID=33923 RepID=UPI003A4E49F6
MKRIYKLSLSLIICFACIGIGYTFFTLFKTNKNRDYLNNDVKKNTNNEIPVNFPKLDGEYFKKFVKTNLENENYIDAEIIQEIIKDIIKRFPTNDGFLEFDYDQISNKEILLLIKYKNNDYELSKKYRIKT